MNYENYPMSKHVKGLTLNELKCLIIEAICEYDQRKDEIWSNDQAAEYLNLAKASIYSMASQ